MSEEPFKNREILEMFKGIEHTLNQHGETHDAILVQVKYTNGRVTDLEKWRYMSMGAMVVLTTLVVPLLSWAMWVLSNIDGKIHQSVDEALTAYEIEK